MRRALLIGVVILTCVSGVVIGRLSVRLERPVVPIVLRPDHRPAVSAVQITSIENGIIAGTMHGDVRLLIGDTVVRPNGSGAFTVPAGKLISTVTVIRVPPGMRFVASKRGKKYYAVTSAAAEKLAPANRVYFPDASSAERAGFVRGQ